MAAVDHPAGLPVADRLVPEELLVVVDLDRRARLVDPVGP